MLDRKIWCAIISLFILGFLAICGLMAAGSPQSNSDFETKVKQGSSLREQGEFHQAIAEFKGALRLARIYDDSRAQLECLMNLGALNWDIGRIKDSDELYRQALFLSQRLGLRDREAQSAAYIKIYEAYVRGKEACSAGAYQLSIGQFNSAIELARKINSPEHELKCLRQMSLNYHQKKKHTEFLSLNSKALIIANKLNHRRERARCLNNIGIYYYENNSYSKALSYYNEALSLIGENGESDFDLSALLNNIGAIYRELGDYDKALDYIKHALEIDYSLDDNEGISVELSNLAATYRRKGIHSNNTNDLYLSLRYNLKSLEIAEKTKNIRYKIAAMNNIGLVYATIGNHSQALKYFQLAISEAESIEYFSEACNICGNMGFVFLRIGEYREAEKYFKKGLELVLKTGRDDVLWEIYFGLGQCLENEGQGEIAITSYRKAIDIIDVMRSRVALDDYKAGFIRDKMKAYGALLNLLYDLKEKEQTSRYDREIFEVVEKAKARAFLEELGRADRSSSDPSDQRYKSELLPLSRKISLTISELTRPDLGEAQRKNLLSRLELEEDKYTSLLNRVKTETAEYAQLALPKKIDPIRIQEQYLDKRSAILEYCLGEKRSFGILLTKNGFILKALPSRAEIEDSLRAFLKMLSTPPHRNFQGIPAGRRIYKDLVYPFEGGLSKSIDHLVLIPDGILHYLPFDALVRGDLKNNEPRFLIELYDISYASSVSSLEYLMKKEQRGQHKKLLLAVGDPVYLSGNSKMFKGRDRHEDALRDIYLNDGFELSSLPHSRREVHRVASCFPDDEVEVLLESQAKEEDIKSRPLEEYQIIHFACHGFLDEKTPMRSALVLTLDDDLEEDGFLQVREISNLRLNADLVVLSACQTGKGRLENAEGVLGLPRAFFYAGARSTISSLWKINDKSTSEIMPDFYRYLTAGNNKARSLRLAKLNMLKSRFSHPFYWAAFVLNGDYLSARR